MKSASLAIIFILMLVNIMIPSTFRDMNVFNPEVSTTLDHFVECDGNDHDGERDDDSLEVEETEKKFYALDLLLNNYLKISYYDIPDKKKSFISSYEFSIFIPPLA